MQGDSGNIRVLEPVLPDRGDRSARWRTGTVRCAAQSSSGVSRRMYESIAAEKAANPRPPNAIARGPLFRARTAPETRPA